METPFFAARLSDLPDRSMRLLANPQCSGRDGGHDLNYRTLQALGVTLAGHFLGARDGVAYFADDLPASVAFADARWSDIRTVITNCLTGAGRRVPRLPEPAPFRADPVTELDLAGVGTVLFTSGYRPDFASWTGFPGAFDGVGFPLQRDGSSTVVAALHGRALAADQEVRHVPGGRRGRGGGHGADRRRLPTPPAGRVAGPPGAPARVAGPPTAPARTGSVPPAHPLTP
ncbi:hypothetical protein ACFQ0M_03640 [Kitasatospora aburaviensis]